MGEWVALLRFPQSTSFPASSARVETGCTGSDVAAKLSAFKLNDSQANAILSCVTGTWRDGEQTKCRVLTWAPTNTAVSQVASHLLALRKQHPATDGGCHGDLLLFGNRDRMAIDGNLSEIFLDTRVKRLWKCFSPTTGWRHCLDSLVAFLGEPMAVKSQYHQACCQQRDGTKLPEASFIRSRLNQIFQKLSSCLRTIMSHVPKAILLEKNYKNIVSVIKMLEDFSKLLDRKMAGNDVDVAVFMITSGMRCDGFGSAGGVGNALVENLMRNKTAILGVTRTLLRDLKLPVTRSDFKIKKFCLRSASFIFCTVSGSAKLNAQKMDLLLIDEAGQLKE
ncbi:hypothetical protein BAE44_0018267 [Dichanthelium oligosanthes]|uniref:DNA2/NAM7 helicase helicase domain-containing protein n=1 Tax=Dichanthelium oligosanthes TaxID=888268 RepID=A0A1E5V6P1_9POAL|nr:hypothetical protein BAE44_0018267 [Dichanthelium oligosanthes]